MFVMIVVEKIKTHILWCLLCVMWRDTVEAGRPQMTMWRMRICLLNNRGYKHALRICNTYCFSTPTMVTRTHLNVTLYVHWLSG